MLLKATTVSRRLLESLPGERQPGVVHSVYDRTVNILCKGSLCGGNPIWLSLHPESMPRHPFSVLVADAPQGGLRSTGEGPGFLGFLGVRAGEPVWLSRSGVVLGEERIRITLDGAMAWDPRLRVCAQSLPVGSPRPWAEDAAHTLRQLAAELAPSALEWPALYGIFGGSLGQCADDLVAAWRLGDDEGARHAVIRLVGLGPGLTPAGDDYLVGWLGALGLVRVAGRSIEASIRERLESTTTVAAFMLRAALEAEFPEPLLQLVNALVGSDEAAAGLSLGNLIGLGETSGQDMLAGVLSGLKASRIDERCHEAAAA